MLHEIRSPRNSKNAEEALRLLYQELVAADGAMLDWEGKIMVRQLTTEGAVETILEAMKGRLATAQLIYRAFGALTLFSQVEASLVAQKGGFDAIVLCLRHFQSIEYVQQAGIVALIELGRCTAHCHTNAHEIVETVVQAMEIHKHSPKIYYLACNAMRISCEVGLTLEDDMALRVHGNLMDGIVLFLSDEQAQSAGREVLGLWVGNECAISMIELRVLTLCTMERILRQAMGMN
jgi:hypothetical protein